MKTTVFKTFLGLGTPLLSSEVKKSFGKDNLIVFAEADKLKHDGIVGPFSLKYNFIGKTYYEIEKARLAISSKKYIFINNGQFYKCENEIQNSIKSLIIFFSTEFFIESLVSNLRNEDELIDNFDFYSNRDINFFQRVSAPSTKAYFLIHSIANAVSYNYDSIHIDELLSELISELCKDQINNCKLIDMQPAKKRSTKIELFKRTSMAYDYIQANYHKTIHLNDLSSLVNMASFHFLRAFKYNFRKSPYQLVTELRLEEAKYLLIKSTLSITEISQKLGFENLSSFTRLFTKHFNTSPLSFRTACRISN